VDIGNHCDDCTTTIALPFAYNFYGTVYQTANVSSNGLLEFGSKLAEYSGSRSLDEVFDRSGHFNRETDRVLAESVLAKLKTLPVWGTLRDRAGK
jgi:hypothetical protein